MKKQELIEKLNIIINTSKEHIKTDSSEYEKGLTNGYKNCSELILKILKEEV